MNELDTALLERMSQIVNVENRPFCYVDFVPSFDLNGQRHSIAYGTYRNKISFFLKIGKVKAVCYSPQAFYTLVGAAFENPIKLDHTGVPNQLSVSKAHNKNNHLPSSICSEQELRMIKNHPVYRVIQNVPYERSALHDIRLKFSKPGIWSLLSKNNKPEPFSKDIPLKEQQINELNIKTTVHHTDKVSVVIGCSFTPVAIDVDGVERLSGALAIIQ